MATRVINLKGRTSRSVDESTEVYIGRAQHMGGWHLARSPWANPFTKGERDDRIRRYDEYIRSPKCAHLVARLGELVGKCLACWCAPARCHGDILRAMIGDTTPGRVIAHRPGAGDIWHAIDTLRGPFRALHPDRIGPVDHIERSGTIRATSLTNLWRAIQVPSFARIGDRPAASWWRNRTRVLAGQQAIFRPEEDIDPENATVFWNEEYVQPDLAYWTIYIKTYVDHVTSMPEYLQLADMVARGHDVQIIGAANRDSSNLRAIFNRRPLDLGYELILVGMLRGERVWDVTAGGKK